MWAAGRNLTLKVPHTRISHSKVYSFRVAGYYHAYFESCR